MIDKEFGKKWVAALRSGEYEQGTGHLFNGKTYCCLGVACRVAGIVPEPRPDLVLWAFVGEKWCAPEALERFGISSKGTLHNGLRLTELNDAGKSFEAIAQYIEEEIEKCPA